MLPTLRIYWLELLAESGLVKPEVLEPLRKEKDELPAIVVSAIKTARKK